MVKCYPLSATFQPNRNLPFIVFKIFDCNTNGKNLYYCQYFKKPFYPNKPRHVHIDIGITEDRCGIACGYIPEFLQRSTLEDHEDPEKIFDIIPKINFDFAFACAPTSGKRLPIYRLKEFLFYLRDELEYPIMSVSLDGFQSESYG